MVSFDPNISIVSAPRFNPATAYSAFRDQFANETKLVERLQISPESDVKSIVVMVFALCGFSAVWLVLGICTWERFACLLCNFTHPSAFDGHASWLHQLLRILKATFFGATLLCVAVLLSIDNCGVFPHSLVCQAFYSVPLGYVPIVCCVASFSFYVVGQSTHPRGLLTHEGRKQDVERRLYQLHSSGPGPARDLCGLARMKQANRSLLRGRDGRPKSDSRSGVGVDSEEEEEDASDDTTACAKKRAGAKAARSQSEDLDSEEEEREVEDGVHGREGTQKGSFASSALENGASRPVRQKSCVKETLRV